MHHEFGREERVGAALRRELALLIRDEVNDPRIGNPTIQEVRVTRDLSQAKVYFTVLQESQARQTGQALRNAAAFLRRRLGDRVKLRSIPQLHFVYDKSVNEGMRLEALIDQAVSHDRDSHRED